MKRLSRKVLMLAGATTVGLLLLALVLCLDGSSGQPRLVILYATCTVNRDLLSPYNASVRFTPNLSRFAEQAVVFEKHMTEAGQSGIAYASLFSGLQAPHHGVFAHPTVLPEHLYLLAEAFRDGGYDSHFWARHPMASPETRYDQGVPPANVYWDRDVSRHDLGNVLTADDPRLSRILDRLQADGNYRAFLVTNFSVTHAPYRANRVEEFCGRFPGECSGLSPAERNRFRGMLLRNRFGWSLNFDRARAQSGASDLEITKMARAAEIRYKSNLYHLDQMFGALIDEIRARDLLEESVIVFTADHGEVMFRANAEVKWNHGLSLDPEVLQIPLLVSSPRVAPGRYTEVTRSVDVYPTLVGLAGLSTQPGRLEGVDLADVLLGEAASPRLLAFSHSGLHRVLQPNVEGIRVALRSGDRVYKLTGDDYGDSTGKVVFDWAADPGETMNLYDLGDARDAAMFDRLSAYRKELVEAHGVWAAFHDGRLPSERSLEIMRRLGYLPSDSS